MREKMSWTAQLVVESIFETYTRSITDSIFKFFAELSSLLHRSNMILWKCIFIISFVVNAILVKCDTDDDIRMELKPFKAVIPMYRASNLLFTKNNGYMYDGEPFFYEAKKESNERTARRVVICTLPKAGSTNLKVLLLAGFVNNDNPGNKNLYEIIARGIHNQPALDYTNLEKYLPDHEVPRFMIVRNPYSKLLSGYLNKIVENKDMNFAPPGFKRGMSFNDFVRLTVEHLTLTPPNEVNFNSHFQVQHKMCAMNRGMTYDYYLKLEWMPYWYEPFVRNLGLTNFTFGTEWNATLRGYVGTKNCYYAPNGKTCADMFQRDFTIARDAEAESRDSVESELFSTHSTSAGDQLAEFYTPAIAKLVTEWAALDFVLFNYSTWDGKRKTLPAFLSSLS